MKLTKKLALVVGLASSVLAIVSSPARAYELTTSANSPLRAYFDSVVDSNNGTRDYTFHFEMKSGQQLAQGTVAAFSFINAFYTGSNSPTSYSQTFPNGSTFNRPYFSSGTRDEDFNNATFTQNFTATTAITDNPGSYKFIINTLPGSQATTFCVGSECATVPEANSALVPVLALGFGFLYRSKKQKKLQIVASQDQ